LQEVLTDIEEAGTSLVAISPMIPKYTPQLVGKLGLTFPVLSDPGSKILSRLGLVFDLEEAMVEIYKGFGIDLERFNGESRWQLPLPGRIIIDREGVVRDVELGTDHSERPEPADSVEILKTL
jgi:peroxiredoxin